MNELLAFAVGNAVEVANAVNFSLTVFAACTSKS